MALYNLTFKCKDDPEKKVTCLWRLSKKYLTTQASGIEKNGIRTVKTFKNTTTQEYQNIKQMLYIQLLLHDKLFIAFQYS